MEELAVKKDWPKTYDEDVLATVDTPVAALIYVDDIYVPKALSQRTVALLPKARTWVTNRMQHDGLRANGEAVFTGLRSLMVD